MDQVAQNMSIPVRGACVNVGEHGFRIIYYIGAKKSGMAAFSYVLQGNPEMGKLKGYWTGYDPEQKKIVSCPYILTKESDIDKIKKDEAKFLDVQCL